MRPNLNSPEVMFLKNKWLYIIDQNVLPVRLVYRCLRSAAEVAVAIKKLQVRGAPWIGVAAAYGLVVEAYRLNSQELIIGLKRAAQLLMAARPTAANLFWAVHRMMRVVEDNPAELRRLLMREAIAIEREEHLRSLAIAQKGAGLIPKNGKVLTICNTGVLAGPGLGTALGVIYQAYRQGKNPTVFVCETRPLLQGARLTAWELKRSGVHFTLIVDSACASVIDQCDLVIVGADRIAANGDTANKIGTRMLALLAKFEGKPFYVAAPSSTFDLKVKTGRDIPIEERDGREVTHFGSCRFAPTNSPVYNPAFDVTPARFITGFITESGIILPPYKRNITMLAYSVVTTTHSIMTGGRA